MTVIVLVGGLAELKSILQLLLCCAMKSEVPVRERHIAIIQSLPLPDQTELMNYIQVRTEFSKADTEFWWLDVTLPVILRTFVLIPYSFCPSVCILESVFKSKMWTLAS